MTETQATDRRVRERRSGGDRRAVSQLAAVFWVADAMVLGLIIFFAIVGGAADSPALSIIAIVAAVLLAAHSLWRHRRRHELTLNVQDRRTRERRGF
jgi:Flp pilus assembly protein TadB